MKWKKAFKQGVTFNALYLMRQELQFILDTGDPVSDTQLTQEELDKLDGIFDVLSPIVDRLSDEGRTVK